MTPEIVDRLMRQVVKDPATDCWNWTGYLLNGYGSARLPGTRTKAHRAMWVALGRVIPEGLQLDHLCRNRACCNPDHLEPVTARENTRRSFSTSGINARRTACVNGHPFSDHNTWVSPKTGRRSCRECNRIRQAARMKRLREATNGLVT